MFERSDKVPLFPIDLPIFRRFLSGRKLRHLFQLRKSRRHMMMNDGLRTRPGFMYTVASYLQRLQH